VPNDLGLAPAECIALEDSNSGLRSSLAASIMTYIIIINSYARTQDFNEAAVFDDLGDLDAFYKATGLPLTKYLMRVNLLRPRRIQETTATVMRKWPHAARQRTLAKDTDWPLCTVLRDE